MLGREQRLCNVREVSDARRARVVLDERLEHVRGVDREARRREQDEQHARGHHRPAQLRAVPPAPPHEVVPAHREQAHENACMERKMERRRSVYACMCGCMRGPDWTCVDLSCGWRRGMYVPYSAPSAARPASSATSMSIGIVTLKLLKRVLCPGS